MENQYTSLIERYFDGNLTPEETAQFNELKESNAEFQAELTLFEKAQLFIELDALQTLKDNARRLDKNTYDKINKPQLPWMKIAASLLLIALVGGVFYIQKPYSNSGLYADAYKPAGDHISDLGSGKTAMESAMQFYNKKKYKLAIVAFTTIQNAEPENQEAKFYLGQSMLLDNQEAIGIATLLQVTGDSQPEARWYAALAQLKADQTEDCIATLALIIDSDQDQTFVKKAKKLKSKLESPLRRLVF